MDTRAQPWLSAGIYLKTRLLQSSLSIKTPATPATYNLFTMKFTLQSLILIAAGLQMPLAKAIFTGRGTYLLFASTLAHHS